MHEKARASITKNRRVFFLQCAGVATAVTVPLAHEAAEPQWSGWREPLDQAILFGFWYHRLPTGRLLVSSTFGQVQTLEEGEQLDLSLKKGYRHVAIDASEAVRGKAQARARVVLEDWVARARS